MNKIIYLLLIVIGVVTLDLVATKAHRYTMHYYGPVTFTPVETDVTEKHI